MGAKIRAGAVLLLVFAAGALSGVWFERSRSLPPDDAEISPQEAHEASLAELSEFLDLDDQQAAQVHAILAKRRRVVEMMWEQLRPEVHQAMQEVHNEISALLRPEQRERFHQWLRTRRDQHGPVPLIQHERQR